MRHLVSCTLFALTCSVACSSPEPERVSRSDCEALREHMVTLRMETVTADHDQHRAALRASLDGFVITCPDSTTPEQLRCSLAAGDFRALAACTTGGAS